MASEAKVFGDRTNNPDGEASEKRPQSGAASSSASAASENSEQKWVLFSFVVVFRFLSSLPHFSAFFFSFFILLPFPSFFSFLLILIFIFAFPFLLSFFSFLEFNDSPVDRTEGGWSTVGCSPIDYTCEDLATLEATLVPLDKPWLPLFRKPRLNIPKKRTVQPGDAF